MKPGVHRLLPDDITAAIASRYPEQTRGARWVLGFTYTDQATAFSYRAANEARYGHQVVGPVTVEGVGVVNLVIIHGEP